MIKGKLTKKISIYDVLFLAAAAAIFIYAVFIPPVHSIADQGDFERVMRPCGLDFPDDYSFYAYAVRFFQMKFTTADLLLYIPRLLFVVPSTAFIFPVTAAKLLCVPLGVFDMRFLAVIMFVWYTSVCFFILRMVKLENPILRCIFLLAFVIVFYSGVNLTLFNSLYGQSVMLASFATLVLASLLMFRREVIGKKELLFFTFASCLLLSSKLQCVVFTPFLAAAVIYSGRKSGRGKLALVCAVLILWNGIGGYVINGGALSKDTQYNSVFYGILKNSPTPEEDLADLGLDTALSADSGKHAYLDKSEYYVAPHSSEAEEDFYSKISSLKLIKFYLTHPARLITGMEITAKNALQNKIDLGTFEEKYELGEYSSSYRFDFWENIRAKLPHSLLFIICAWVVFLLSAVICMKKGSAYGLALICLFIIGALQFAMPYVGNGEADIPKQLFMFNIIFDFGIIVLLYIALKAAEKYFKKSP